MNTRVLATVASGIVLIGLAGGGIYGIYHLVVSRGNAPIAPLSVPSIVFADEYKELSGTGPSLVQALAQAAGEALVPGNVLVTYVTEPVSGDNKNSFLQKPAPGGTLITALRLPAPDILLRNIAPESTVGITNAGGETRPFFALRVDSYERTYAGILTWEPLMARDLAAFYPLYPAESVAVEPVATTTQASSTPVAAAPVQTTARTRFTDAIVANHDVRILRDTMDRALIVYGYADKQTLIIARNEAAFEILLSRLQAGQ